MKKTAEELIKNIDWSELRNQKRTLLMVINEIILTIENKDNLEGILSLIDQLQDYAVDELGIDSIHVFDFDQEDPKDGEILIPVDDKKKSLGEENVVLEDAEKPLLMSIINNFGDDQHPVCDEQTLDYFHIEYVKGIINNNEQAIIQELDGMGKVLFTSIKKTLGIL